MYCFRGRIQVNICMFHVPHKKSNHFINSAWHLCTTVMAGASQPSKVWETGRMVTIRSKQLWQKITVLSADIVRLEWLWTCMGELNIFIPVCEFVYPSKMKLNLIQYVIWKKYARNWKKCIKMKNKRNHERDLILKLQNIIISCWNVWLVSENCVYIASIHSMKDDL